MEQKANVDVKNGTCGQPILCNIVLTDFPI